MVKVYVVQQQFYLDRETGRSSPRFTTLDQVKEFGEIVELLNPSQTPFKTIEAIEELHRGLGGILVDDFLLPIGNSTLVSWAVAIASYYLEGKIKILQWSVRDKKYIPMNLDLF